MTARFLHRITLTTALMLCAAAGLFAGSNTYRTSPHGSQTSGVLRVSECPRGSCAQCHTSHSSTTAQPYGLFSENSNRLCMTQSFGGCHADQPTGGTTGYPAQETDRLPLGSPDPGYFEYNSGGIRVPGTNNLVRWPGQTIWENIQFSSHYSDPDMPLKDAFGNGACDNCHDVHGGSSAHDMLDTTYSGIAQSQIGVAAESYLQCLQCHSIGGPLGMSETSKRIADYYDRSINASDHSGHGIATGGGYVPTGARLPCYDCHNPHGSQGNGGGGPNDFLLSDQRQGWYALTDIRNDNAQARRFCFGCHKSADFQGGGQVEGLTLQPLSNSVSAHAFAATTHCYDCHGRDYSSPTSHNVHNPAGGDTLSALLQPQGGGQ